MLAALGTRATERTEAALEAAYKHVASEKRDQALIDQLFAALTEFRVARRLHTPQSVADAEAQVVALYDVREEIETRQAEAERLWLAAVVIDAFATRPGLAEISGFAYDDEDQSYFTAEVKWATGATPNLSTSDPTARWIEEFYPSVAKAGWMRILQISRADMEAAEYNPEAVARFLLKGCKWH